MINETKRDETKRMEIIMPILLWNKLRLTSFLAEKSISEMVRGLITDSLIKDIQISEVEK